MPLTDDNDNEERQNGLGCKVTLLRVVAEVFQCGVGSAGKSGGDMPHTLRWWRMVQFKSPS